MDFRSPVEREIAAKDLPLGHVEIKYARQAVEEEYRECFAVTREVKIQFRMLDLKAAEQIVWKIWEAFGCSRRARVFKTDRPFCFCTGRNLYLNEWSSLDTILHELAHAIVHHERLRGIHDQDYLWVLRMVREYARDHEKKLLSSKR